MQPDSPSIQILFTKYINGEASAEETAHLFQLIEEDQHDTQISLLLATELDDTEPEEQYNPAWELTLAKIKQQTLELPMTSLPHGKTKLWPRIAGIAAMVALMAMGIYFFSYNQKTPTPDYRHLLANDIAPGKLGATLTLANGEKIRLSDAANGEIAKESGISISKTADGQIVYQLQSATGDQDKVNTLTTAKGETFILTLPDQTKVWLNAASSLTYTANLRDKGVRRIRLSGEAYFEVSKDKEHPFIVESGDQQVEVLGTHFNVNAYPDEKVFRTTLLEGSVKVSEYGQTKLLTPGNQASNAGGSIQLGAVDTDLAIAWKSNNFIFDRLDIKEIMRTIARWYNVEVIYQGDIPTDTFWGSVSRFDNISKVLIPLEATGNVHFKIEGRKIYVFN
ncbi:putative anti-sigma factor [Pedobacter sp. BAL39]|uniref:FecR family protein n=1 Tax=Pedobacter sp. BAL39 TaxID=391596 RepID=UPI00015594DF|nr:FecR family protein [Pedobacter sp. BAL39]EDM38001.1 putative anti-sigma factor [Pedobacter sp. BAL39]